MRHHHYLALVGIPMTLFKTREESLEDINREKDKVVEDYCKTPKYTLAIFEHV